MPDKSKIRGASFNIPSNRLLVKSLGEYDALVEYQEVSNRLMLKELDNSNESFRDYLTRVSEEVNIYLKDITLKDYKAAIIQGYLVFPNASFDEFLSEFVEDVRQLIDDQITLSRLEGSHFEKVLEALKNKSIVINLDDDKVNLYHYYRLLRNDLAHRLNRDYADRYNAIHKDVIKGFYPSLSVPNQKDSLSFDDFILCTANIKSIAFEMTKGILPYINWVEKVVDNREKWIPEYQRFLNENRIQRLCKYIDTSIFNIYGLRLPESDINTIIGSLEQR